MALPRMVLRIKKKKTDNQIFKVYMLAMFALMILRYIMKVNVPSIVFLMVAMLPIWMGSPSEQLAFVASCIPFSIAFQYKYALLILSAAVLLKKGWKLKNTSVISVVALMMVWEFWHAYYGDFAYVEYLRDFAELILLGVVATMDMDELEYKLVIRSLAVSVVGVCAIMLFMQLQQYNFNLIEVFIRSAHSFRFGQSNMESGTYALNFNANNLGFICNLSITGILLLASRKEHNKLDILLAIAATAFMIMTLSRAAIICAAMIFVVYILTLEGNIMQKVFRGVGGILVAALAVVLVYAFIPSVFDNLLERFQRNDHWNGRDSLLRYYSQFLLSSPMYFLFGVGMQGIFEKVSPYYPVHDVPHLGIQEVWIAWGFVGVVMMLVLICGVVMVSRKNAGGKRTIYQFMPLILVLVFTTSGQLLTSSRALMAFSISFVCLSIKRKEKLESGREADE